MLAVVFVVLFLVKVFCFFSNADLVCSQLAELFCRRKSAVKASATMSSFLHREMLEISTGQSPGNRFGPLRESDSESARESASAREHERARESTREHERAPESARERARESARESTREHEREREREHERARERA